MIKASRKVLKKSVIVTTLSLSVLGLGGVAGAAGSNVQVLDNTIKDLTPIAEKSTTSQPLEGVFTASSTGYSVSSKISGNFSSFRPSSEKLNAIATSSATKAIDSIYAKARIFENGGLVGSASDTNSNSSYTGVTAKSPSGFATWDNDARGNHSFKEAGFKDVYHETYTSSW